MKFLPIISTEVQVLATAL